MYSVMCSPVIYLQNAYYRTLLMVLQRRCAACFITDPHAQRWTDPSHNALTFKVHKAEQTFLGIFCYYVNDSISEITLYSSNQFILLNRPDSQFLFENEVWDKTTKVQITLLL